MENMTATERGVIAEGFEMTSYEMACCSILASYVSPGWDREYAPKTSCFLACYGKMKPLPTADRYESLSATAGDVIGDENLSPEQLKEKNRLRKEHRQRRREVVDAMLVRAGYEPTQSELDAYFARFKAFDSQMLEWRKEWEQAAAARKDAGK